MELKQLKIGDMEPRFPIVQGGMGVGISLSKLAAAVAKAGGIGTISGTGISVEELRYHIRTARKLTKNKGYIGVNVLFAMNDFAEKMKAAMEEKVDFIVSGAGISRDMYAWGREHGIPVISIVSTAKLARLSERLGAAAVVVEVSIADRLSHQCGDLSHYFRSTEPLSAGVRAIFINVANNINNHGNSTRSNGCLYYYLNLLSLNS